MVAGGENFDRVHQQVREHLDQPLPVHDESDGAPGSTSVSTRTPSSPSPWHASVSRLLVFTGCGMNVSLPASIREMSSRSSTRRINRSGLDVDDREVLLDLLDGELGVSPSERVDEPPHGRERRAELMARDGDEVRLQLVELAQSDEHLLLLGAQPGGLHHQ